MQSASLGGSGSAADRTAPSVSVNADVRERASVLSPNQIHLSDVGR